MKERKKFEKSAERKGIVKFRHVKENIYEG